MLWHYLFASADGSEEQDKEAVQGEAAENITAETLKAARQRLVPPRKPRARRDAAWNLPLMLMEAKRRLKPPVVAVK